MIISPKDNHKQRSDPTDNMQTGLSVTDLQISKT